jgi:peptide/nickel transport system permease protein
VSSAPLIAERTAAAASDGPGALHRLLRRPPAKVSVAYLILVVGVAIVAPLVLPGVDHEQAGDLLATKQGPSWHHLLGTDTVGRDVLDRLLVGTRVTMIAVLEALAIVLLLGVPIGLAAGYLGGAWDRTIGWFVDLTLSMPGLIIVLVVLTVFSTSNLAAMTTVGVLSTPFLVRVVRSATLPVREELYIAAAQVSGLSRPYIITRHVLPRIAGAVVVQSSLLAGAALLIQAGLAFLGLLITPPAPSWGGMLNDGLGVIIEQPWLIWPPGAAIALTILAFGLLGDAVRDTATEAWSAPVRPMRPHVRVARAATPSESAALLSVTDLRVMFPGPVTVVDGVSFDIASGETVGLVGESGCGKTVTAMSILGLLPGGGEVVAGNIAFEGRDLAGASEQELRRVRGKKIGLVSQEPMISLNPALRVGWQLAHVVRTHHDLSHHAARTRVLELLELVRLPDPVSVSRRYPFELSGGMAQRVAIARALAGEPKLLIADEPTTALDVTVQAEILDLLRDLQRERGMAVLLVTHDWGVVADLCDRAIVMYAGQVVERAGLRPIFSEPLHPYTEALLASNPHNTRGTERLPTIQGLVPKPGTWPIGCHFHPRCGYATAACRERAIPLCRPAEGRETRCIHYEQLVSAR